MSTSAPPSCTSISRALRLPARAATWIGYSPVRGWGGREGFVRYVDVRFGRCCAARERECRCANARSKMSQEIALAAEWAGVNQTYVQCEVWGPPRFQGSAESPQVVQGRALEHPERASARSTTRQGGKAKWSANNVVKANSCNQNQRKGTTNNAVIQTFQFCANGREHQNEG